MPKKMVEVDVTTAAPHHVMKVIIATIAHMGTNMMSRVAECSAAEEEENASAPEIYAALEEEVSELANKIDKDVERKVIAMDAAMGTTVLAVLQVAVWTMQRYIQAAESEERAEGVESTDPFTTAEVPDTVIQDFEEYELPPGVEAGVLLRRKVRGDQ